MEALAVERPHTLSIKPHGEKAHEFGIFGRRGFGRRRYFNNYSPDPRIH
jgi:hypothetical protein